MYASGSSPLYPVASETEVNSEAGGTCAISEFLQHRSPHTALCYLAENDGKMAQEAVDNLQLA